MGQPVQERDWPQVVWVQEAQPPDGQPELEPTRG